MEKAIVSCCGVVCSACPYHPKDCAGCPAIRGRVFWLEYTGGDVCGIYHCCVEEMGLAHCGKCATHPGDCPHWQQKDPTKSDAENEADFQSQLEVLEGLP